MDIALTTLCIIKDLRAAAMYTTGFMLDPKNADTSGIEFRTRQVTWYHILGLLLALLVALMVPDVSHQIMKRIGMPYASAIYILVGMAALGTLVELIVKVYERMRIQPISTYPNFI